MPRFRHTSFFVPFIVVAPGGRRWGKEGTERRCRAGGGCICRCGVSFAVARGGGGKEGKEWRCRAGRRGVAWGSAKWERCCGEKKRLGGGKAARWVAACGERDSGPPRGEAAARAALRAAFVSVDKFRKLHKIPASSPIIPGSQVKLKYAGRRTINPQRKIEEKERSAANRECEGDGSLRRTREGVPSRLASERSRKFYLAGSFEQLLRSKVAKSISMELLAGRLGHDRRLSSGCLSLQACFCHTRWLSSECDGRQAFCHICMLLSESQLAKVSDSEPSRGEAAARATQRVASH